jgi:serine/threonine-protein kinase HSL1, negative regulator of Swe1 kinase
MPETSTRSLQQRRASYSTIASRSSHASSKRAGHIKKSASYKRRVSFPQQRRQASTTSNAEKLRRAGTDAIASSTDVSTRPNTRGTESIASGAFSDPSLPTPPATVRARRPASDIQVRKGVPLNQSWRDDTRKVSQELGKICEEAFNRSSISSTSANSQYAGIDTPPTSVDTHSGRVPSRLRNRPLPETPVLRELREKREKVIEMFKGHNQVDLKKMLVQIDALINEEMEKQKGQYSEQRASSMPLPRSTMEDLKRLREDAPRAASDPLNNKSQDPTVRLVPASSPAGSKTSPVNARKNKAMPINSMRDGRIDPSITQHDRQGYDSRLCTNKTVLDTIQENPGSSPKKKPSTTSLARKWSWLNNKRSGEDVPPSQPEEPSTERTSERSARQGLASGLSDDSHNNTAAVDSSEQEQIVTQRKKWFQKMFSKSNKAKQVVPSIHTDHEIVDDASDDFDANSMDEERDNSRAVRRSYQPHTSVEAATAALAGAPIEISQNWLAKFFRIKPATRIICLQVSKTRARKDIVRILKDWRKYGLRDVVCEKRSGGDMVRGRVDACNCMWPERPPSRTLLTSYTDLHIKPVNFHAFLYCVLEHGRKADLSVMKFIQEKGAASSFYRVVETLESVLRERGLVVMDPERKKGIERSLKDAGL